MDLDEVLIINQVIADLIDAEEQLEDEGPQVPRYHPRVNAFQLSDRQFIKNFRLTKQLARELIEIVTPHIAEASRASAITIETKVLVALHFYGHGSYQTGVGKHITVAISQPSVSRCLRDVTRVLNMPHILDRFVHFPQNLAELRNSRNSFFAKYQFPGIIGVVDGTHVTIKRPNENEDIYVNRKDYHSLNVQLVCDEKLKILHVTSRFPGGSHDSHVWRQSAVSNAMIDIYREINEPFFLLEDSGYPLRPYLLTPFHDPAPGTPDWRFNRAFMTIRSLIERCNGNIKNRFRCLLRHRTLHYEPEVTATIVHACVVLYNMCIEANVPEPEEDGNDVDYEVYEAEADHQELDNARQAAADLAAGQQLRNRIVYAHFRFRR